jgi:hypothetical protein
LRRKITLKDLIRLEKEDTGRGVLHHDHSHGECCFGLPTVSVGPIWFGNVAALADVPRNI